MAVLGSLRCVACCGELQPLESSINNGFSIFLSEPADPAWVLPWWISRELLAGKWVAVKAEGQVKLEEELIFPPQTIPRF